MVAHVYYCFRILTFFVLFLVFICIHFFFVQFSFVWCFCCCDYSRLFHCIKIQNKNEVPDWTMQFVDEQNVYCWWWIYWSQWNRWLIWSSRDSFSVQIPQCVDFQTTSCYDKIYGANVHIGQHIYSLTIISIMLTLIHLMRPNV